MCNCQGIHIILVSCFQLLTISERTYSEKAEIGNAEPIKVSEQVGALFGHMSYTGTYLEDGFNLILSEVASRCGVRRERQLLLEGRTDGEEEDLALDFDEQAADVWNRENEKSLQEIQTKLETLDEKLESLEGLKDLRTQVQDLGLQIKKFQTGQEKFSNVFDMSVEIASGPEDSPALLVFTTLDGVPHKAAEIEIEGYDPSKQSNYVLDHDMIILGDGKAIVTFTENPQLLFVKATLNIGESNTVEHTELVALK